MESAKSNLATALALAAVLMGGAASRSEAALFDFDSIALGTATPFSDVSGGITADFSSPDGAAFFVASAFFATLGGKVLLDADTPLHALDIQFDTVLTSISLLFALNGPANTTQLIMEAFLGGISQGIVIASGTVPGGFVFPEGFSSFSAAPFDSIRLTSDAQDFAIDRIDVSATAVPEPASLALWLIGLAGARAASRRRLR